MSGEENANIDRKLSASLSRFGLRGRGSANRLPALKPPRDLTLGGTPKRTFTPNIVSRSTKKEEVKDEPGPSNRRNQRTFKPKLRGRGRGRGRGEIISSAGIFSQGPVAQQTLASVFSGSAGYGAFARDGGNRGNYEKDSSSTRTINTTKGDNEDELISDKVFEMLKDEGKIEWDEEEMKSGSLAPITLPLTSRLKRSKKENLEIHNMEVDDEDKKFSEAKFVNKLNDKKPINKKSNNIPDVQLTDLFTEADSDGKLLFFQFPDALPIRLFAPDDPNVKQEAGMIKEQEKIKEEKIEEQLKDFTFENVSEGVIGKLQIFESGKVKIRLGNVYLDVSLGTPCGFLQDLISVQTERDPPEMICLGHVNHRLIAVPDYASLLGQDGI